MAEVLRAPMNPWPPGFLVSLKSEEICGKKEWENQLPIGSYWLFLRKNRKSLRHHLAGNLLALLKEEHESAALNTFPVMDTFPGLFGRTG